MNKYAHQVFYECEQRHTVLKSKLKDCCIFYLYRIMDAYPFEIKMEHQIISAENFGQQVG